MPDQYVVSATGRVGHEDGSSSSSMHLTFELTTKVARCTKIIQTPDETKYLINIKQIAKFVVALGDKVAPSDIEEGMRVGLGCHLSF